jgi:hypothetical protein
MTSRRIEDHGTNGQAARAQRFMGEFKTSPRREVNLLPFLHD